MSDELDAGKAAVGWAQSKLKSQLTILREQIPANADTLSKLPDDSPARTELQRHICDQIHKLIELENKEYDSRPTLRMFGVPYFVLFACIVVFIVAINDGGDWSLLAWIAGVAGVLALIYCVGLTWFTLAVWYQQAKAYEPVIEAAVAEQFAAMGVDVAQSPEDPSAAKPATHVADK